MKTTIRLSFNMFFTEIRKNLNMSTIRLDRNESEADDKWLNKELAQNKRSFSEEFVETVDKKLKTDSSNQ